MILDSLLFFTGGVGGVGNGDGLTDSPTTGTQNSSNVLDLAGPALPASQSTPFAAPGRDLGIGDDPALKLHVLVTVAFASGTNLQVGFAGAPDNGAGSPGTYTTYAFGPLVVEATLTAGVRILEIDWPRPDPLSVPPRFVRLSYVTTGTHTAGKIEGMAVLDRFDQPLDSKGTLGGYIPGIVIAN
jgi:hypothetical protein